jgi:hypothetical protein
VSEILFNKCSVAVEKYVELYVEKIKEDVELKNL